MSNACQKRSDPRFQVSLGRHGDRRRRRGKAHLCFETLEARRLLAADWQNPLNHLDVDGSGLVTPQDALMVINDLNERGSRLLLLPTGEAGPPPYLDADGDGSVSPADVLLVVNALNAHPSPIVLAASLSPDSDPDGNGVVLQSQVTVVGQTTPGALVRATTVAPFAEADSAAEQAELPGQQQAADASGRFQLTVELSPGTNVVQVEATDPLGRKAAIERVIRYGDVVLNWNASMLNVIRDWTAFSDDPYPNRIVPSQPPMAARNLAMVHAAMYDAVNAIERAHQPYRVDLIAPEGASPVAAAAAAAHRVASNLYRDPDERAVFDAALFESLAVVPDGPAKALGIELGYRVADAILAWRSSDGASSAAAYTPGIEPGDWNRTFPAFLPPLLPQWPDVTPFAMTGPAQFRPAAPPALDSAEYAAAVDQVMQLGRFDSATRTAEQTEIARFWADGGGTFTPPGHWNQIAADVALAHGTTLADNARLFALLNIALADAGIASWDAKYAYNLWRPIDAIRRADLDGNEATVTDPVWMPLIITPPFPSYTSGHSSFSGAAEAVLSDFFGSDVHFTSQSDGHSSFAQRPLTERQVVTRHFVSFTQAAEEASHSRIYGGIHFDFDSTAGLAVGRAVGAYIAANFLSQAR